MNVNSLGPHISPDPVLSSHHNGTLHRPQSLPGSFFLSHSSYGYSMSNGFTLASNIVAMAVLVCSKLLVCHLPQCECWTTDAEIEGSMRDFYELQGSEIISPWKQRAFSEDSSQLFTFWLDNWFHEWEKCVPSIRSSLPTSTYNPNTPTSPLENSTGTALGSHQRKRRILLLQS